VRKNHIARHQLVGRQLGRRWVPALAFGSALVVAGAASARSAVSYQFRSEFVAASPDALFVEGFEGEQERVASSFSTASGLGFSTADPYSAIESSYPIAMGLRNSTPGGSRYLHIGDGVSAEFSPYYHAGISTFTLPNPTRAFGLDLGGFGESNIFIQLLNGSQVVDALYVYTWHGGIGFDFLGVIGTNPFDGVRLVSGYAEDDFSMDQVTWGVPAPATAPILLAIRAFGRRSRRERY
jgi:hypothetical protein